MGGAHGVEAGLAGELFDGAVLEDEDGGPDEVGEEASPENDDEDGEVLPEVEAVVGEEFGLGELADGRSGVEAEGEEGAHDAGEDGDGEALAEVVVGLACFSLLFGGDFVFFRVPAAPLTATAMRQTRTPARMIWPEVSWMMVSMAVVDGRDEGAEGGAEAEGDGVSKSDAEVADGEAEGEAACSPEDAPEDGVVDAGCGRGVEDAEEIGDEETGEDDGRYDPGGESLNEPVDLP